MSNDFIEIESDYEYVLGELQGNVLNLQAQFSYMDWTRDELEVIAKELENTGKTFAMQQGLIESGTLIDSTHAVVTNNHNIDFFNNANLGRGFYAGHVEYGHHTRNGGFVPARPFMRPALYAVSEASVGRLQGALSNYLNQIVYGQSSLNILSFGKAQSSKSYTRAFYQSSSRNYTSKGLYNSHMNKQNVFRELRENSARRYTSVVRGDDSTRGRFMTQYPTGNSYTDSTYKYGDYER